jgi:hypothetical protein
MDLIKIFVIMLYLVQLYVNIFFGSQIGKIANLHNINITPSSWVFFIWIIIYSFQFYIIFNINKENLSKIFLLYALTFLLNILWIFAFTNLKFGLSVILILSLLACIIFVSTHIKIIDNIDSLLHIYYSTYIGWLSIASFLAIFTWLKEDFNIFFDLTIPFIIYTFIILQSSSFNLYIAIPYLLVYFDMLFVKK